MNERVVLVTRARHGILVIAVLILGWRVISLGLGDFYSSAAGGDGLADVRTALVWNPADRDALAALARAPEATSDAARRTTWERLLRLNPTDSFALLGLAQSIGGSEQADSLVRAAAALRPVDAPVLKQAAGYWLQRGADAEAVAAWSQAMLADPQQRQAIFPALFKLFEDARTRGLLAPYAARPPAWWDDFFREVAAAASDVEAVRGLVALRRAGSSAPLSETERAAYVARLRKEGMTSEAYLTWVNGLDETHRQRLGLLNNGGFEVAPVGNGWDWRLTPNKNLAIERATTYGIEGEKALHLAFRGFSQPFSHVSQDLFLEPGAYRLSGLVRPSALKTTGGLAWAVDCNAAGQPKRLGETERFLGSNPWKPFELRFEIPTDCRDPVLRLIGAVRVSGDRRIDGGIWFDALRIQRL